MLDRAPRVLDIDWFNDMLAFKRLDLDPPYQRYSVWSRSYKQYFVDTILNDFPSPGILLHKEDTDVGPVYHLVDGKQRLLAIFDFQAGKFPLEKNHDQFLASISMNYLKMTKHNSATIKFRSRYLRLKAWQIFEQHMNA